MSALEENTESGLPRLAVDPVVQNKSLFASFHKSSSVSELLGMIQMKRWPIVPNELFPTIHPFALAKHLASWLANALCVVALVV